MTPEEIAKKEKDDAYDQKLLSMFIHLTASGTATPHDMQKFFGIYNEAFDPKEAGYTCGGCIQRVMERSRAHLTAKGLL